MESNTRAYHRHQAAARYGSATATNWSCKVETDEGIYGLGESGLSGRELAVIGALKHYREFLIGADPMQRGRIWQELYRSQYFEGGRVLLAAQSAIDIALYDIAGKALGVPVYQLLGGKQRDTIPCFATASGGTGEADARKRRAAVAARLARDPRDAPAGQRRHGSDVWEPRESIPATPRDGWSSAREKSSARPDAGHRLPPSSVAGRDRLVLPAHAARHARFSRRADPRRSARGVRSAAQDDDVPFAVGEEFSSKWQFAPFIERHLTDFARVDICNVGGFTEAMKVAGWAEAHYIDLMPHNPLGPICTAATIQLAAAVANFAWLEVRVTQTENLYYGKSGTNEAEALFPIQPVLDGTGFPVPDAPGLGVELDMELAEAQSWKFWEAPHWRRRDGSVTNW